MAGGWWWWVAGDRATDNKQQGAAWSTDISGKRRWVGRVGIFSELRADFSGAGGVSTWP